MGIERLRQGVMTWMAWTGKRNQEAEASMGGGEAPAEPQIVLNAGLERTLLFVYRLRALLMLPWDDDLASVVEGCRSEERFFGVRDSQDFQSWTEEDLVAWMKRVLAAHETRVEQMLAQEPAGFRTQEVLLAALGMDAPIYEAVCRYLWIVMQDEATCRFLDRRDKALTVSDHLEVIAALTGQELDAVEKAIRRLAETGLVTLNGGEFYGLLRKEGVRFSKKGLLLLQQNLGDREALIRYVSSDVGFDDTVGLDDYPHIRSGIELAQSILTRAARQGKARHLLLVGPPGTGKTTFAFALARALDVQVVPVAVEDDDGDHLVDDMRLSDYRFKQALFHQGGEQTLLLFDEAGSLFDSPLMRLGFGGSAFSSKARVTALMDAAKISTIWITNSTEDWDPAYLRRFSQILRFPIPPLEVRKAQVRKICAPLPLSEAFMTQLAERHLPVALLRQTVEVVAAEGAEQQMRAIIDSYLATLGEPPLRQVEETGLPPFDSRYLNLSVEAEQLFGALDVTSSLRLLFDGPPGSGKTELARQIARHVGKELLEVRASDLLDKYVGGTEQRIAAWFARGAAEDAVLLIDEADSVLRSRTGAAHSWEVSQVNELLVQIEAHTGIVILGTNYREVLDEALIRRMDFKVGFRPLTLSQRTDLFRRVLAHNGSEETALGSAVESALAGMDRLVVGDFRPPVRRLRVTRQPLTPASLIRELRREYEVRYPTRSIGFMGAA